MEIKSLIESLLFINETPIKPEDLAKNFNLTTKEVIEIMEELKREYEERNSGICILKVAGGYQMCTSPKNSEAIKKFYKEKFKQHLSSAALEVLAIIAYKQPLTKLEIESIRGVNCEGVIKNLLKMGLIRVVGRKKIIGRPFLYGTTRKFLEHFGLNSLDELPKLEEGGLCQNELKEFT